MRSYQAQIIRYGCRRWRTMIQFAKLSGMGQSALNDHADGKKHLESVKESKEFP